MFGAFDCNPTERSDIKAKIVITKSLLRPIKSDVGDAYFEVRNLSL